MTKKYQEIPSNFGNFKNYIIYNKDDVISTITSTGICFFYDTCSILHHSNSSNRQTIINYLKSKSDTIIITRTVLMELTANSFLLHPTQLQYFKELSNSGIKVVILDEEIVFDCLKEVLDIDTENANKLLGYAVKEVSKQKTKVYDVLENMDKPTSNKLRCATPGNKELFGTFFRLARSMKTEGDSIAEELILVCVIILTKIPMGKYILISDDLRMRSLLISVKDYISKHHERKEPYQLTTASLIYKMFKESLLVSKEAMLEIMRSSFNGNVSVFFIGEDDIELNHESFSCDNLVDRLVGEREFKIIY